MNLAIAMVFAYLPFLMWIGIQARTDLTATTHPRERLIKK